jgi:hypothetical protein
MSYGTIKVDTITFTDGGVDKSVSVSGLTQNPTITGNLTVTGTISGELIQGQTVSGATVTGDTGTFTTATAVTGVFTTSVSGSIISGDVGQYATLTGISGVFTGQVSGTTITGDVGQYATLTGISGVFTTSISGVTVTGDAGNFTTLTGSTGVFTTSISGASITGGVATITSGVFALGEEALPSISFSSDPDTGIYSPGADQVAISTNGTGALFVDANGNVGVGAAPSTRKFRVKDSLNTVLAIEGASTGTSNIFFSNPDDEDVCYLNYNHVTNALSAYVNASANPALVIDSSNRVGLGTSDPATALEVQGNQPQITIDTTTTGYTALVFATNGVNDGGIYYNGTNDRMEFYTADTSGDPQIVINASGNVGIGVTSPADLLHSAGNIRVAWGANRVATVFDDSFRQGMAFDTTNRQLQIFSTTSDTGGSIGFYTRSTAGSSDTDYGTEKARIDVAGRLLVGTSSTSENASIICEGFNGGTSDTDGILRLHRKTTSPADGNGLGNITFGTSGTSGTQGAAWILGQRDGGTWTNGTSHPGRLVFSTTTDGESSPTERMRITKQGVVKISRDGTYLSEFSGVHEIRTNLDDNNTLIISSSASNGTQYGVSIRLADDQNDTTRDFLECRGGATVRAQIRSNGGLANYQSNNVDLSDERTKRDITSASSTWSCVQAWEVVNYNYLDDPADDTPRVGVIAQQVQQHCPEVVIPYQEAEDAVLDSDGNVATPAKEERLGVREQQMMWMAIKALQEAQTRIESLEAEVAALKGA